MNLGDRWQHAWSRTQFWSCSETLAVAAVVGLSAYWASDAWWIAAVSTVSAPALAYGLRLSANLAMARVHRTDEANAALVRLRDEQAGRIADLESSLATARTEIASRLNYVKQTLRELASEGRGIMANHPEEIPRACREWGDRAAEFVAEAIGKEEADRTAYKAAHAAVIARERKGGHACVEDALEKVAEARADLRGLADRLVDSDLRPDLEVPQEYLDRVKF